MTTQLALWAVPRAVGTAFERVFVEREDTSVVHEAFMPCYYYSKDRVSSRYDSEVDPRPEFDYTSVKDKLDRSHQSPILFVKEIAFHMSGINDPDFWSKFQHTFILRDPRVSVPSLYNLMPDLTLEEAGFPAISRLFQVATERFKQPPVVVNGDSFRSAPTDVLGVYCELVGIPFLDTTTWSTSKLVPEWSKWRSWHEEALTSTHIFQPPPRPLRTDFPERIQEIIEQSMPYYNELNQYAIRV